MTPTKKFCAGDPMIGTMASCVDECKTCYGRPFADSNGMCKDPSFSSTEFYCGPKQSMGPNCAACTAGANAAVVLSYENTTTRRCEVPTMPPVSAIPNDLFHCVLRDGEMDDWVQNCHTECKLVRGSDIWRKNIADPDTQTCVKPSAQRCNSMGMAHCSGGNNNYGMCVTTCHHCHVRSNDEYTIGGVNYEHRSYNNSGVCETTVNARTACLASSGYWCEAMERCYDSNCSDCKYTTGEEFTFEEAVTGGGYECTKRDCESWESFCPSTMTCMGCNGDDCLSNCDLCPGSPIEKWVKEPAYASVCAEPSESLCADQWMDYCEADKTCKDRWGDSNTCMNCQGDSNWSPSSPGKCSKREEVVATCSGKSQYYFKGACYPDCAEVVWEGMPLAANASEAMCSVAQVAEHMRNEVTVYANEYMDMESDPTMEGDYSEYAGEEVPPMEGMIGEFDPYDPKESETSQDIGMMEDLEKEYEQHFHRHESMYGKGRRRRRLTMAKGKFEKVLPKKAIDDRYNARGGPVKPGTTGETMAPLALYDLCSKSMNMAPECSEKAPPLPADIATTTETRAGFYCSHYNTIVFDCKKCDCDTMPADVDGVMTCMAPIPATVGCTDSDALNYDRCAGDSRPELCDFDFERFELVPDIPLNTSMTFEMKQ